MKDFALLAEGFGYPHPGHLDELRTGGSAQALRTLR
jgi:hypothetical protein